MYIYILFPKPTINAENSNPTSGPGADEHQPELALEGVRLPAAPTCQNTLTDGSEREEGSREPPDLTDRLIAVTSRTVFSMQRTRHANSSNTHTRQGDVLSPGRRKCSSCCLLVSLLPLTPGLLSAVPPGSCQPVDLGRGGWRRRSGR